MTTEQIKDFIASQIIETSEAAEILNCSRQNIDDLIRRGKLVPVKELKKNKLFLKSDVLARLQKPESK